MKIVKRVFRCAAIVQPGEYTITRWDGKQCTEDNPRMLVKCEHCEQCFCLVMHWHVHLRSIQDDDTRLDAAKRIVSGE